MSRLGSTLPTDGTTQVADRIPAQGTAAVEMLRRAFGTEFHLIDGQTGEPLYVSPEQPACDWAMLAEMCREVLRRGRAEFLAEETPLLVLAVPLVMSPDQDVVAVASFVTRPVGADEDLTEAAQRLGMDPAAAHAWAQRQSPCSPTLLDRLSSVVLERLVAERRFDELEQEARQLSVHLASTYEEISLLHRLTQKLRISQRDEDLGRMALEWLEEVVPAQGLAIQFLPVARPGDTLAHQARTQTLLLTRGDCPFTSEQFGRLMEHVGLRRATQPVVLNRQVTANPEWPFPEVRQLIAVALVEGENLFGWLAAVNHASQGEFGTVEASLLSSVATIVGIHSGNLELYRQQAELLAGVVRALTSAIDAKDPYTCGHSDRVARIAVRLAQELGCPPENLDTIYLSGLLHDIGKIGINASVLRKPGKLKDVE